MAGTIEHSHLTRRSLLAAIGISVVAATVPAVAEVPSLPPLVIPGPSLPGWFESLRLNAGDSLIVEPRGGAWITVEVNEELCLHDRGHPLVIHADRSLTLTRDEVYAALAEHLRILLGCQRPLVLGVPGARMSREDALTLFPILERA